MGEITYKRGETEPAAQWLEKSVAADRRQARSHWLLGNIHQDQGRLDRAITSYRRALRATPDHAEAHNDLGTAYYAKGWYPEAEQCYRAALQFNPDSSSAVENLATALRAQGKLREARTEFVRALKLRIRAGLARWFGRAPRVKAVSPPAQPSLQGRRVEAAKAALAAGRLADAKSELRLLLSESPESPEVLHLLGVALYKSGERSGAIPLFERAIALHSSNPEFYVALGNVLADERRFKEALENFQAALLLDPGHAIALANIGRVLHDLGHFREAAEVFRVSLDHDPDLSGAQSNLASTLHSLGKFAEAEIAARKAIEINPRSVHALVMLATTLVEQDRIDEAREAIARAQAINHENTDLLQWIGKFQLTFEADLGAAESTLERARSLAPEDPNLRVSLARVLLMGDRFAEGWEHYEWRKRQPGRAITYTRFPYPEWDGQPLEGKAVVVNGEQGLGDEIMFACCLSQIAARAGRCVLYCNRRLEVLFKRSFDFAEVHGGSHLGNKDPFPILEGIDFQVAAASLPRVFRRSAAEFPEHAGYLKADPAKTEKWRRRLLELGAGINIGLSWKGGTPLSDMTRRTLRLDQLEPILALQGTRWISLQYGECRDELDTFIARTGTRIHHWQEAIDDLDETAALLCALDLRISVCNTQVHLSGGLAKEVWVLAPLAPDWRYGHKGSRMLWYPAARMFRQPTAGDWATPLAAARLNLEALLARA